jgi:ATP-binding cassette subfamily B protein
MEESISGQHVVISFRKQDDFLKEFDVKNEEVYKSAMKAQVYSQLMMPITGLTNTINIALMAGAGGALALNGMVSVGVVATMLTYTQRFMQPIRQLATMFNTLQGAIVGAERVFEILDQVSEIQNNENSKPFEAIKGKVVFENVDFSYVEDTPVLKNVNFEAEPGEMVALVGPTGAGKTTIVNILSRFYDIQAGSVKIDDVDVRDYNKEELRRGIGMVLQDGFLFAGTVMDNIRYGRLEATEEECIAAAKMANAHSFIHRLPKGYNTVLTERGENISQGQRQLLTIARAILANPQILILDEATSSVDTRTEVLIQKGLHALMEGRTSFVIAHRLSTIRDADKLLVIDNGEIVEQGTHDSLLEKRGFYYKMYMQQFRGKAAIE